MTNISKYFIPAALAIMALAGCANDDSEPNVDPRSDCPAFSATISDIQTRAFDQSWESGDEIGVSGCKRSNVRYHTKDGDGSFAVKNYGEQIYFQDETEASFAAYYPWKELADGAKVFDIDTRDQTGQKSFDFLWAQATGKKDAPNVTFNFAHRMAKVTLTLKPGNGMDFNEMKGVELSLKGFSHSGSFDISNGATTVGRPGDAWSFSDLAQFDDNNKTVTFSFIFIPQLLDTPLDFLAGLDLEGDRTYNLRAEIDFTAANRKIDGDDAENEWVAGRQYNLSLTLHKTEISLDRCVINPWNPVTGDDIIVD